MKNAILDKGKWRKIGKPKVVSVATPAKPASLEQPASKQKQESASGPKVSKVVYPQSRQVGSVVPVGPVVEEQRVEREPGGDMGRLGILPSASTFESEPTNPRQTERIDEVNQMQTNTVVKPRSTDGHYSNNAAAVIEEVSAEEKAGKPRQPRRSEKLRSEPSRRRTRDLQGGMELLGLDFLLSVVENTTGDDELDITMRKLNFNELIRTDQLQAVDSNALKVYALNSDGHYDKHIQCEAIKELSVRTTQGK
ncbi:MAG TPA: hypothetical protein HPP87_01095 [Planctomycetes bacterium]|nr:hypothetical protein [Planctomycetota bacterium]